MQKYCRFAETHICRLTPPIWLKEHLKILKKDTLSGCSQATTTDWQAFQAWFLSVKGWGAQGPFRGVFWPLREDLKGSGLMVTTRLLGTTQLASLNKLWLLAVVQLQPPYKRQYAVVFRVSYQDLRSPFCSENSLEIFTHSPPNLLHSIVVRIKWKREVAFL